MDDAVQIQLGRDFELLPEICRLLLFVTRVVFRAAALRARQAVIIQSAFADGDGFGMAREFAEFGADVGGRCVRVARMPADGGENHFVLFRECKRAAAAVEIGGDGNNLRDAGGLRAGEHVGEVRFVIVVIEMRVGVVENRHDLRELENIEHPTSNNQHPMQSARGGNGCSMLDVGCWMLKPLHGFAVAFVPAFFCSSASNCSTIWGLPG